MLEVGVQVPTSVSASSARALPGVICPGACYPLPYRGALVGPVWALALSFVLHFPRPSWPDVPLWILYTSIIGAIFAETFYVTCGLPQHYADRLIEPYSRRVKGVIRYSIAILGAILGVSITSFIMSRLFHFMVVAESTSVFVSIAIAILLTTFFGLAGELKREREMRQRIAAEAAARAQVAALQAQINPHFFFNTLNTLSALVGTHPEQARDMIQSLAGMFRYSLACSQDTLARLDDEVQFVENYLALEQARLGDRMQVSWSRSGDLSGIRLPGLALQPLVENAIRHGIARRLKPGSLEITMERHADELRVSVRNQVEPAEGPPDLRPEQLWREGHALSIVRQRLATQYGDRSALTFTYDDGWVTAELRFPAMAAPVTQASVALPCAL